MKTILADAQQDAELRRLAATDAMPGWVRLAYAREPDFFTGTAVEGTCVQVIAGIEGDRFIGMGTRALKPAYINGAPQTIGYLGGLRSWPEFRGGRSLFHGYRLLRQLHADGRCPFYLTTILADNRAAQTLLASGRAGLPRYADHGLYHTHAFAPTALAKLAPDDGERGTPETLPEILAFLAENGRRRQFFPVLEPAMFGTDYLRGLSADDFVILRTPQGAIAGVTAVWDQRAFRQLNVLGYSPLVRRLRPLLNPCLRLLGSIPLPAPGTKLACGFLSFFCVRQDDPALARRLLSAAARHPKAQGLAALAIGLHERDPLHPPLAAIRGLRYRSRLYLVAFAEDPPPALDYRPPWLELGSL